MGFIGRPEVCWSRNQVDLDEWGILTRFDAFEYRLSDLCDFSSHFERISLKLCPERRSFRLSEF